MLYHTKYFFEAMAKMFIDSNIISMGIPYKLPTLESRARRSFCSSLHMNSIGGMVLFWKTKRIN